MSTKFSVGQMNQLADALEVAGFTSADVTKLRSPDELRKFKLVLDRKSEIVAFENVIYCDADPFVPMDLEVAEHQQGGQFEWNPDKIELYFCDEQKNCVEIDGHELRQKLEERLVPNANVLDYLLKHPQLIPDEWKEKWIYFWGTIYRGSDGSLYVRCLSCYKNQWSWRSVWLDTDLFDCSYSLLLRSTAGDK